MANEPYGYGNYWFDRVAKVGSWRAAGTVIAGTGIAVMVLFGRVGVR